MSDFTDRVVSEYLAQRPTLRRAVHRDALHHAHIQMLRQTLDVVDRALIAEGVPDDTRRRVVNTVVWGDPYAGIDAHHRNEALARTAADMG